MIAQAFLLDAEHNVRPGHSFEKNPYPQNIIVMVISLGVTGGVAIIVAVVACGGIIKEVNFLVMTVKEKIRVISSLIIIPVETFWVHLHNDINKLIFFLFISAPFRSAG